MKKKASGNKYLDYVCVLFYLGGKRPEGVCPWLPPRAQAEEAKYKIQASSTKRLLSSRFCESNFMKKQWNMHKKIEKEMAV